MTGEVLPYITAAAAVTAAIVSVIGAINAARSRDAGDRATIAAENAEKKAKEGLIEVNGSIYSLGQAVDGRLSKLLDTTEKLARAEGHAEGEQAQRDRAAEAQP